MSKKIDAAADVTRQVSDTMKRVASLIGKEAPINRVGVYIFPEDQERVIRLAAAELNLAVGLMARTPWPKSTDYEESNYTV